jgi:hypothetical protein
MTYQVVYKELPYTIEAFTVSNLDDNYTIFLNARLSYNMQMEAFKHEMMHIFNGDFDNVRDISKMEFDIYGR